MELLMKLDNCLQKLEGAYAPNTLKSYYADARAFVDWCAERNIEPFPIASETLRAYIEGLRTCTGNYIILMDADLSHHVSEHI